MKEGSIESNWANNEFSCCHQENQRVLREKIVILCHVLKCFKKSMIQGIY